MTYDDKRISVIQNAKNVINSNDSFNYEPEDPDLKLLQDVRSWGFGSPFRFPIKSGGKWKQKPEVIK